MIRTISPPVWSAGSSLGGDVGALYVGDERRAFAAYVLEHTDDGTERSEMIAEAQEAGQAPTVQWLLLAEANA